MSRADEPAQIGAREMLGFSCQIRKRHERREMEVPRDELQNLTRPGSDSSHRALNPLRSEELRSSPRVDHVQTAWDTKDSCRDGQVATTLDQSSRVDCGSFESISVWLEQGCWIHRPGCSQHVNAVQSFGTIHLRQHLVHNAVRNSRRVVASAKKQGRGESVSCDS